MEHAGALLPSQLWRRPAATAASSGDLAIDAARGTALPGAVYLNGSWAVALERQPPTEISLGSRGAAGATAREQPRGADPPAPPKAIAPAAADPLGLPAVAVATAARGEPPAPPLPGMATPLALPQGEADDLLFSYLGVRPLGLPLGGVNDKPAAISGALSGKGGGDSGAGSGSRNSSAGGGGSCSRDQLCPTAAGFSHWRSIASEVQQGLDEPASSPAVGSNSHSVAIPEPQRRRSSFKGEGRQGIVHVSSQAADPDPAPPAAPVALTHPVHQHPVHPPQPSTADCLSDGAQPLLSELLQLRALGQQVPTQALRERLAAVHAAAAAAGAAAAAAAASAAPTAAAAAPAPSTAAAAPAGGGGGRVPAGGAVDEPPLTGGGAGGTQRAPVVWLSGNPGPGPVEPVFDTGPTPPQQHPAWPQRPPGPAPAAPAAVDLLLPVKRGGLHIPPAAVALVMTYAGEVNPNVGVGARPLQIFVDLGNGKPLVPCRKAHIQTITAGFGGTAHWCFGLAPAPRQLGIAQQRAARNTPSVVRLVGRPDGTLVMSAAGRPAGAAQAEREEGAQLEAGPPAERLTGGAGGDQVQRWTGLGVMGQDGPPGAGGEAGRASCARSRERGSATAAAAVAVAGASGSAGSAMTGGPSGLRGEGDEAGGAWASAAPTGSGGGDGGLTTAAAVAPSPRSPPAGDVGRGGEAAAGGGGEDEAPWLELSASDLALGQVHLPAAVGESLLGPLARRQGLAPGQSGSAVVRLVLPAEAGGRSFQVIARWHQTVRTTGSTHWGLCKGMRAVFEALAQAACPLVPGSWFQLRPLRPGWASEPVPEIELVVWRPDGEEFQQSGGGGGQGGGWELGGEEPSPDEVVGTEPEEEAARSGKRRRLEAGSQPCGAIGLPAGAPEHGSAMQAPSGSPEGSDDSDDDSCILISDDEEDEDLPSRWDGAGEAGASGPPSLHADPRVPVATEGASPRAGASRDAGASGMLQAQPRQPEACMPMAGLPLLHAALRQNAAPQAAVPATTAQWAPALHAPFLQAAGGVTGGPEQATAGQILPLVRLDGLLTVQNVVAHLYEHRAKLVGLVGGADGSAGAGERPKPQVPPTGMAAAFHRILWTPALHVRFMQAVDALGGVFAATPSAIHERMQVEGLTKDQVQYYLSRCRRSARDRDDHFDAEQAACDPGGEVDEGGGAGPEGESSASRPGPGEQLPVLQAEYHPGTNHVMWTPELRDRFTGAVNALGGLKAATAKPTWQRMQGLDPQGPELQLGPLDLGLGVGAAGVSRGAAALPGAPAVAALGAGGGPAPRPPPPPGLLGCLTAPPSQRPAGAEPERQAAATLQAPRQLPRQPSLPPAPPAAAPRPLLPIGGVPPSELPLPPGALRLCGLTFHPDLAPSVRRALQDWEDSARASGSWPARLWEQVQIPGISVAGCLLPGASADVPWRQTFLRHRLRPMQVWTGLAGLLGLDRSPTAPLAALAGGDDGAHAPLEPHLVAPGPDPERGGAGLFAQEAIKPSCVLGVVGGYVMPSAAAEAFASEGFRLDARPWAALVSQAGGDSEHVGTAWSLLAGSFRLRLPGLGPSVCGADGCELSMLGYGNEAALVNDPRRNPRAWAPGNDVGDEEGAAAQANCMVLPVSVRGLVLPVLVALRDIAPGEQLLRDYGAEWWRDLADAWEKAERALLRGRAPQAQLANVHAAAEGQ